MATIVEQLKVFLDGAFAGEVAQDRSGRVSFTYDPAYLARPDPTPLSQVIGTRSSQYKPSHVKNWFDGLLPDNTGVREEWGRRYQISARNPLALLRFVGRDAAGAVQVVPRDEAAPDSVAQTGAIQWLTADEFETLLEGLRNHRGDWGRGFRNGRWSLAGAQNKVALLKDGDRWGVPLDSTPTTHIVKTSIGGYHLHDVNEYASQRAAQLLGIPAANTSLSVHGSERAVVSTRFDRTQIDGRWRRIHQEDLCQALGVAPALRYQSDGGPGVNAIRRVFARFALSRERVRANRTFFDYLTYNFVIGATDAHAKNFSILHVGSASRLAPMYDVASGLPYLDGERIESAGLRIELPRSALKIGTTYDLPAVTTSDIAKVARGLGLVAEEGVERFQELARRAPGAFEEVAATLDDPAHARFVRALAGQIEAHVAGRWRNGVLG